MTRKPLTTPKSPPNNKRKFRVMMRKRPIITINNNANEDIEEEDRTNDILQGAGSGRNLNVFGSLITKAPR